MSAHVYTYVYTHGYTHVYTYVYTHVYTHVYTSLSCSFFIGLAVVARLVAAENLAEPQHGLDGTLACVGAFPDDGVDTFFAD